MTELNIPLFQKIHAQITRDPSSHYQGSWETCGTSRCIAGWAVHFEAHGDVYEYNDSGRATGWSTQVQTLFDSRDDLEDWWSVSRLGMHLLGLTVDQASRLFYADEYDAAEAVRLAAEEGPDEFAAYVKSIISDDPGH